MPLVETASVAIAKLVIERGAPAGVERLSTYFKGKTIMIVGPVASGKTTFLNYLQAEVFLPAHGHVTTLAPDETKPYQVSIGTNQSVKVTVKTTVDMPGQYTATQLANAAVAKRPHAFVIVLDLTNADSPGWFEEFCIRLDQGWQNARRRRNRLRSVVVALNKTDLVDDPTISDQETRYREIASRHWTAARGPHMDDVVFMPSVMVQNPAGASSVDAIVVRLVKALEKRK
jgi:signal recognition particle receptor subunit beta